VDIIIERASDGSIILLHDGRNTRIGEPRHNTISALKEIIPQLGERGLEIVPIDRLCKNTKKCYPLFVLVASIFIALSFYNKLRQNKRFLPLKEYPNIYARAAGYLGRKTSKH